MRKFHVDAEVTREVLNKLLKEDLEISKETQLLFDHLADRSIHWQIQQMMSKGYSPTAVMAATLLSMFRAGMTYKEMSYDKSIVKFDISSMAHGDVIPFPTGSRGKYRILIPGMSPTQIWVKPDRSGDIDWWDNKGNRGHIFNKGRSNPFDTGDDD